MYYILYTLVESRKLIRYVPPLVDSDSLLGVGILGLVRKTLSLILYCGFNNHMNFY